MRIFRCLLILMILPATLLRAEEEPTLREKKEAAKKFTQAPGSEINPQDFLETPAARAFIAAHYNEALVELEKLEAAYPRDVLIKRYKGLTLDRMKRYDEAIQAFNTGLQIIPDSVPTHYFLAETLLHKGDLEAAKREFQYVIDHDETGAYKT